MKLEINFDLKSFNTDKFIPELSCLLKDNETYICEDDDLNIPVNTNFINHYKNILDELV